MLLKDIPRLSQAGTLELAARRVVEGLYAGRHRSPATGSAVEFADHRAYLPGDDLRAVDWKVAARSDHLLVRRYREERDLPLVLAVDTSASMAWRSSDAVPEKRAWAALATAALGILALDQGDRVRLASGDRGLVGWHAEMGGAAGAAALCRLLDDLPMGGATDLPELLAGLGRRLERRALIVLFSDLLCDPEPLGRPLGALAAKGHDLCVVQVLDRAEIDLPAAWGLSALTDPEVPAAAITCDAAAAKAAYDAALRGHRVRCARLLSTCRADHVEAITDRPGPGARRLAAPAGGAVTEGSAWPRSGVGVRGLGSKMRGRPRRRVHGLPKRGTPDPRLQTPDPG